MTDKNLNEQHVDISTIVRLKEKYHEIIFCMAIVIVILICSIIISMSVYVSFLEKLVEINAEVTELGIENEEMRKALDYSEAVINKYDEKLSIYDELIQEK